MILRVKGELDSGQLEFTDHREIGAQVSKKKAAENEFAFQAQAHRLPRFERNYRFASSIKSKTTGRARQWAVDFAFLDYMVAVEVEGMVFRRIGKEVVASGRHASPAGFREDCIKYAHAAILGWTLIRFEQTQVMAGVATEFAMDLLISKGWKGPVIG
jgi:very-short-patch-repair endonuclease